MSAVATVMHLFNAGDEIICTDDCYGGTARLLKTIQEHFDIRIHFVSLRNPDEVEAHINDKTKATRALVKSLSFRLTKRNCGQSLPRFQWA